MNAGSTLKYFPVKWKFQRKVQFEGEGYFEVAKGKSSKLFLKMEKHRFWALHLIFMPAKVITG
ncbi:MAG: hypothetical protein IPF54_27315 [Draconibacterium sp.]|nr:hypothetical protein [Draconibacterium sp.]